MATSSKPAADAAARVPSNRLLALLAHRRLPLFVATIGVALVSPSLFIGFHLDDYVHRYLLSDLPGASELLRAYESPFGIANGERAINHWQIEKGYAPWWTPDDLLISLFRPISELTHRLDAALFPDSAVPMHVHNLLWYGVLCFVAGVLYRSLTRPTAGARTQAAPRGEPQKELVLGGLMALLYATDYTHGFAVGWIANRNAVVAACFGVLSLWAHHEGRTRPSPPLYWASPILLGCALLAGEGSLAIFGYLLGHALFLDPMRGGRRLLAIVPHAVLIVAWRALYNFMGRGARGSGLYLDPVREPLRFVGAALERIPMLVMGEIATPPAQSALFVGSPWAEVLWGFALAITLWLAIAVLPLLRGSARGRFFAFGMATALVPACTTHPHSRLLFFVGIGALGLLAELWHGVLSGEAWVPEGAQRKITTGFAALFMGFHLLLSPLLLSLLSCSVALTAPIQRGVESALALPQGRELVVLNAPEYFYVKLIPVEAALSGRPGPRRLRALSFGAVPLQVRREDPKTLHMQFEGGLLRQPLLELYRAADNPMPVGSVVELEGLSIEVTGATADGHIASARFRFAQPLEDERYLFVAWDGERFTPFEVPAVGSAGDLPPAQVRFAP